MTFNAVDLFSGTGSATKYFRESDDWNVVGIDIDPDREEDIEANIFDIKPEHFEEDIDFVWGSPPCKSFSVANIQNNWTVKSERLRLPQSQKAVNGVGMVFHTLRLIESIDPDYWFMENPRGGLRKIIGEPQHDRRRQLDKELLVKEQKDANYPGTVTYCRFGDNVMKPTDLWGEHPESFEYRYCGQGKKCHNSMSRNRKESFQFRNKGSDRWRVPDGLAEAVFEAVDEAIREE